jgi:hypothetical protein
MNRKLRATLLLGLSMLGPLLPGCDKTSNNSNPPTASVPTSTPAESATAPSTVPATEPAPAAAAAPAGSLPLAKDVLPEGEVSGDKLVVIGDGYRFQVKPELKPVPHPLAGTAYTGSFDTVIGTSTMTVFVTHEPFTGDLDALAKRQTDAAKAAGGTVTLDGPVKTFTAGSLQDGYRFLAILKDDLDEQVMVVHDGTAWVLHSTTPNVPNAFAMVGSDLAISGATFHVAPPKGK